MMILAGSDCRWRDGEPPNPGRRIRGLIWLICLCAMAIPGPSLRAAVSCNRNIRPILSDHCYACHGPDEKARKGGLRLDLEQEAIRTLKSGRTAIVARHPETSELVARIKTDDPDDLM